MSKYFFLYILTIPVFFIIDMLWLGLIARDFYKSQLSSFLGPVNWSAAIIFYLLFIIGIIIFAVIPALNNNSIYIALIYGVLFGFFTYTTYDLTNLATLKNWPLTVVIVDILWGSFLSGTVASASYYIGKNLSL